MKLANTKRINEKIREIAQTRQALDKVTGEATVEGDDADDAKDSKSIAEVESLEEECDFCVYEHTTSNGYT